MIKIARKEKQTTQAKYLDKISVFRGTEHYTRISANCETAKQKKKQNAVTHCIRPCL